MPVHPVSLREGQPEHQGAHGNENARARSNLERKKEGGRQVCQKNSQYIEYRGNHERLVIRHIMSALTRINLLPVPATTIL